MLDNLQKELQIYSACGNVVGIAPLSSVGIEDDVQNNIELRSFLTKWGKENNLDSIMVLTGDPLDFKSQGYHFSMIVFEPFGNGNLGGFSTMCGNGVRAVAKYTQQFVDTNEILIKTQSGILPILESDGNYTVRMGRLVQDAIDLDRYVNRKEIGKARGALYNVPIPSELGIIRKYADTWSVAFTTTNEEDPDGEPHLIIQLPVESKEDLRTFAMRFGQGLTYNNKFFPEGINVNFISTPIVSGDQIKLYNVTHERNLGDTPEHSITQACGTGSTSVAGVLFKSHPEINSVIVQNYGGNLEITRDDQDLLMTGEAHQL